MKLILASQSPWRKKLLSWLGVPFEVMVSEFDEGSIEIDDPEELVMTLALKKAETVAKGLTEGIVVGADTIIAVGRMDNEAGIRNESEIIGKPGDMAEAREILLKLKGREHRVYTGVVVLDVVTGEKRIEAEETVVTFSNFSNQQLNDYLETEDSLGKAGAYQILKIRDTLVSSIEGSVTNVIGLPLKRLTAMLEEMGIEIEADSSRMVEDQIGTRD